MALNPESLPREAIAAAFNEWMRRYVADPAAFEAWDETTSTFKAEDGSGFAPSYGEKSADTLIRLMQEAASPRV